MAQNEKYNASAITERLRDHAWFIAFAPADAPRIAVAVLVENGGFGASAAAPIARKVMDAYLLGRTSGKVEARRHDLRGRSPPARAPAAPSPAPRACCSR